MIDSLLLLVFPAAMALAASCDIFTFTVPNRLTIAFALAVLLAAIVAGMPAAELGMHILAGAAMLSVGFALFAFGWIGGGDAKFFAATALWLGWSHLLVFVVWIGLLGGLLTLFVLKLRAKPLPAGLYRWDWAFRLHNARSGIPYGVAIASAGLLVYPHTAWFAAFSLG